MSNAAARPIVGRHYRSGRSVQVECVAGRIASVREVQLPADEVERLPWLAPGFIDVQSNGYGGQEFSSADLTTEQVATITAQQNAFGVTQYCPTVTTTSRGTFLHALSTVAEACRRWPSVNHAVAGIHVEGPYISPEDGPRGAHPLAHCRPPDWDEFQQLQDAAEGRIVILTMSAEYPQAAEFIARAVKAGVVIALGHTAANSAQIRAAVDAGASLSTHLGNGAHRMLRRHPNYLWDQLADDRLMASLIVDGHHLPAEVVKTFVRAKTPERCLLVSDLSGLAGLPAGRYETELCNLEILDDGRLVIAGQDQLLAGASRPIGVGIANVIRFAGVDLATAVEMATRRPAQLLGRPCSELEVGDAADLVLFDLGPDGDASSEGLHVRATISQGAVTYSSSV
jgi:N-acetylglucosamine-6-phosphate deacetylase